MMKITLKPDKETILKLLKNTEMSKKLRVFSKLNDLNEIDRTKILLKVLENGSWCLREKSAHELARLGTKVMPRLMRLCSKGYWFTRAAACLSLGEIGDPAALPPILKLVLKDDNPTVAKEARIALVKIVLKDPQGSAWRIAEGIKDGSDRAVIMDVLQSAEPGLAQTVSEIVEMPALQPRGSERYHARYPEKIND
ncbi:MAG TPA: HEAT repeat domain-containing protein [bacterium]